MYHRDHRNTFSINGKNTCTGYIHVCTGTLQIGYWELLADSGQSWWILCAGASADVLLIRNAVAVAVRVDDGRVYFRDDRVATDVLEVIAEL